jgi:hypothetical protein
MGAPEMRFPRSVTSATVRAYCFGYKDWASGVIIVLRLLSYFLRTWVRKYNVRKYFRVYFRTKIPVRVQYV